MLGKLFPEVVQAAQPASQILPPPKLYNNHLDQPGNLIHHAGQSHHFFYINAGHASGRADTPIYLVSKLFSEDVPFLSGTSVPSLLSLTDSHAEWPLAPLPPSSGRSWPCHPWVPATSPTCFFGPVQKLVTGHLCKLTKIRHCSFSRSILFISIM